MLTVLLEGLPVLAILYSLFFLGQLTERRRYQQSADPRPVIQSLRRLLAADPLQAGDYRVHQLEAYDALATYDQVAL